jgi:hypothetical protein
MVAGRRCHGGPSPLVTRCDRGYENILVIGDAKLQEILTPGQMSVWHTVLIFGLNTPNKSGVSTIRGKGVP